MTLENIIKKECEDLGNTLKTHYALKGDVN